MAKIESFTALTLRFSGMRGVWEYEILPGEGRAQVSRFDIRYDRGEDRRTLTRRGECGMEEMLRLMNECGLLSWDGFHGKHPRGVLDGLMFSLVANVNGDVSVKAEGSQNFPRRFRDFTDALYEILKNGEAQD